MSGGTDFSSKVRPVVPDAVPDPPRFSSNWETPPHNDENKTQGNDRPNQNETPAASASGVEEENQNSEDAENRSTTSRTNSQNGRSKPKKSTKSKNSTSPKMSCIIINNSENIKIGPTYKYVNHFSNIQNYNNNSASTTEKCEPNDSTATDCEKDMPQHVDALSASELEITKDDMLLIKGHMGHGWKQVFKNIGYTKGQIDQFLENYKYTDEAIYQILLDWKQNRTKEATIGRLVSALWSSKEYECAELWAATRKS